MTHNNYGTQIRKELESIREKKLEEDHKAQKRQEAQKNISTWRVICRLLKIKYK